MTRIVSSADGRKLLKSFSYFGPRDSNEVLRELIDKIDSDNAEAEKVWNSLTAEEKERRTAKFSASPGRT